jgi:drug/metabolite transporter (DMT)-like permease
MLLVIRPGGEETTGYVWMAVLGVSALAARDLVTRLAPEHIPALALSTWGFASTIPAGLVILAFQGGAYTTDGLTLFYILCAVLVTSFGYLAITMAMRMAPVSIVAPFRYTRLIFTAGLGIVIFGERPDPLTWVGAAIILAAGLYTFLRERRLALAG